MNTPSDFFTAQAVLIKEAANGNETAFKELYNTISGKMYSLCLRYSNDANEANDLFQDGFIKLYNNLHNFRNEGSFEGWARRIFVNICLDHIKKKAPRAIELDSAYTIAEKGENVNDKLSMDDLMKIIQGLPTNHKTIINLNIIEGYSHKEIAEMLNITVSASKSQLHKARIYLTKFISK